MPFWMVMALLGLLPLSAIMFRHLCSSVFICSQSLGPALSQPFHFFATDEHR